MRRFLYTLILCSCIVVQAQEDADFKSQVRHAIDELVDFIALPNDALNASDINRNIRWLSEKFSQRGFNTSVLPTEGQPLFFAALPMKAGKPTLLFYMHFDGQSVDPSKWEQPDPYKTVLKSPDGAGWKVEDFSDLDDDIPYDWRLFGRSTSDDKGPIVMFLNTIDLISKSGQEMPFNVKVILDGEEEKSSKPLPAAVEQYRELLEAGGFDLAGITAVADDLLIVLKAESEAEAAAALALGREHIIPCMFRTMLGRTGVAEDRAPIFHAYLNRHIHLDEDFHAPLSLRLLNGLCGDDPRRTEQAVAAARVAVEARLKFWDGVLAAIEARKAA